MCEFFFSFFQCTKIMTGNSAALCVGGRKVLLGAMVIYFLTVSCCYIRPINHGPDFTDVPCMIVC